MSDDLLKYLGPLAVLAGVWEGDKGDDVAPSDDRGTERNQFRERMTFEPFGPVNNHEQQLYGLRYSTVAWRLGEDAPFSRGDRVLALGCGRKTGAPVFYCAARSDGAGRRYGGTGSHVVSNCRGGRIGHVWDLLQQVSRSGI
jgi:hypothetical protein